MQVKSFTEIMVAPMPAVGAVVCDEAHMAVLGCVQQRVWRRQRLLDNIVHHAAIRRAMPERLWGQS